MEQTQPTFQLDDAIKIAEGYRELDISLAQAEAFLKAELTNAHASDFEKKAELSYYLLRLLLRKNINFETPVLEKYAEAMTNNFHDAVKDFQSQIKEAEDVRKKSLITMQLRAFYKLIDRFYVALEHEYDEKGFDEARDRTYVARMMFRLEKVYLNKAWGKVAILTLFQYGSNFGMSFSKVLQTALMVVCGGALFFAITDVIQVTSFIPKMQYFGAEYLVLSLRMLTGGVEIQVSLFAQILSSLFSMLGMGIFALGLHTMFRKI